MRATINTPPPPFQTLPRQQQPKPRAPRSHAPGGGACIAQYLCSRVLVAGFTCVLRVVCFVEALLISRGIVVDNRRQFRSLYQQAYLAKQNLPPPPPPLIFLCGFSYHVACIQRQRRLCEDDRQLRTRLDAGVKSRAGVRGLIRPETQGRRGVRREDENAGTLRSVPIAICFC